MKAALRSYWESRRPWERLAAAAAIGLLAIVLYFWLLQSAHRSRVRLRAAVSALQAQALRLDRGADEIARLRAAQPAPQEAAPQADFRLLMQSRADSGGVARWLVRIDAVDATQVRVIFGGVPFTDWLGWVASLQAQHIRLDAARIEAQSTPGLVSVSGTFVRPPP